MISRRIVTLSQKSKRIQIFRSKNHIDINQRVKARECRRKTFALSSQYRGRQRQIQIIRHTFGLGGSQRDIMTNFTLFFIKILFGYCVINAN
jgi:hypothetical protein